VALLQDLEVAGLCQGSQCRNQGKETNQREKSQCTHGYLSHSCLFRHETQERVVKDKKQLSVISNQLSVGA
jgi:hypothetical protein